MTRACGADDIKNILHPALFRKLRFQMIDDSERVLRIRMPSGRRGGTPTTP
jgi:hypothetical protein